MDDCTANRPVTLIPPTVPLPVTPPPLTLEIGARELMGGSTKPTVLTFGVPDLYPDIPGKLIGSV